ncbi:MAG: hypothetical protein PHO70_08425 [Candidatus Omnitrophica bacterium]|nr:hypothetical protein [Candidatus Omnitrophota bacterium]
MKPVGHIVCTAVVSSVVYLFFKSFSAFVISFVSGVLIDVDHIFDYYLQERPTLKLREIYSWCINKRFSLLFLFFHSLELIVLLWVIVYVFKLGVFWIAFSIGITQHMILDLIFNRAEIHSYSYFLSYRLLKGFRKEPLMK